MAVSFQRPSPASSMRHPSTAASSSQVPASAPVLEFRCMFTHDVHKKQKKWHDGTAKYHTFNKKVMVYDESKNLVGGLHYRQPEEFGEGLEIKLDRPVLVQVEDQVGESTTDLTPLINRPGSNNVPNNNTQPVRHATSRLPGPNSQIKPKSIKELLAGSQGHIGRARLPPHSPFEQRQVLNEIQLNARPTELQEPPAKRQKLATTEAPVVQHSDYVPVREHHTSDYATPAVNSRIQGEPALLREVMNISSDDEPITTRREAPAAKPKPRSSKQPKPSKDRTKRMKVSREMSPSQSAVRVSEPPAARPLNDSTSSLARPSSAPSAQKPPSFLVPDLGPRSTLKFASQKPRPKLMYRALLMGTPSFSDESSVEILQNRGSASERRSRLSTRRMQSNLLETDEFFALSQIRPVPTPSRHSEPVDQTPKSVFEPARTIIEGESGNVQEIGSIMPSPLFVSQPDPQSTQNHPQNCDDDDPGVFLEDIRDVPDSSPSDPSNEGEQDFVGNQNEQNDDVQNTSARSLTPSSAVVVEPASACKSKSSTNRITRPMPAMTFSSPVESHSMSMQCSERNFRRVFSESTANIYAGESLPDDDFSDEEVFLEIDKRDNNAFKSSKSAPKSVDSGLLDQCKTIELAAISEETTQGDICSDENDGVSVAQHESRQQSDVRAVETGPWTVRESFLLFDWWPRSKEKPDYGQGTKAGSVSIGIINDEYEDVTASIASRGLSKKYGTFGSARFVSQR